MGTRSYWLNLFNSTTWQEFLDAGAEVSGFPEKRWSKVQQIKPGDYLLCYLTRISRWIGVLEVVSDSFLDKSPIWKSAEFPCRVKVKVVVSLTPETAVPVLDLSSQLELFNVKTPNWGVLFRTAPKEFKCSDGEVIVSAVMEAKEHPVIRPVDSARIRN